jgi:hypothetical protein
VNTARHELIRNWPILLVVFILVFGWIANLNGGTYSTGMLIYGCVGAVATLTLLPVSPRHWVSPAERKREQHRAAASRPAVASSP